MNDRQLAISMGAIPTLMPNPDILLNDLVSTFLADVQFYGGSDSPMRGLFAARTMQELTDLYVKLREVNLRVAVLTSGSEMRNALRMLSSGNADCIVTLIGLNANLAFRLQVNRLTIASLNPLSSPEAIQLLTRAPVPLQTMEVNGTRFRRLVWLKPEPVDHTPLLHKNMLVTFNDKITALHQDALVSTLIAMGCVVKVELGMSYGFDTREVITKDAANAVHRALNPPDDD